MGHYSEGNEGLEALNGEILWNILKLWSVNASELSNNKRQQMEDSVLVFYLEMIHLYSIN